MKRSHLLYGLAVLVLAALLPLVMQGYGNRLMNTALISAIAVIGLNFVFGYAGLISLAHAAFVGVAAYLVAILTTTHGWNPWLAALLAIAATCLCAYVTGCILLRLKGHYLALATLGLNVSFTIVVSNWLDVTGGSNGISGIPALSLAGIALDDERGFYWFSLAVLALLAALAACVRHSHAGRALMAVRDDELATAMTGLPVTRIKVAAFTLGAAYAAVAGCLFAFHIRFVSPEDFNFSHSIIYLAMLIVGGEGSIVGAMLGAVGVTLLPELLRGVGNAYLLVFGLLVLVILVVLPRGLISLVDPATYRRRGRPGVVAPAAHGGRPS
ncbi:branched-chain amino acid ABC transporter permease [Bordetella sp. BOR01]|uniref:branched-chain amino acid ABC transporter permease n=1 Tax=Bordetella sp. BOR01 TaxID=2854779 RepID=UPI001C486242|nr:branched-chain amino acid ABC transporter permease [Bordetella sp. BOR01]MBV7481584.1 branched-chain amino acid ABC transporter permease [Bordetella sp. BOR01]